MAVLIAKASGNFTDSTSWGVVDATSYLNAENGTESLLTTAYSGTRSSAFTPGAIEIDGIAVKLCERIGTTGTISVQLELDAGDIAVAGTEVTINVADLPSALETDLNGGWIFFKFAAPVLLLAATAYQVAAKTSSATQVDLWCDGTADNLARALRTTTEAAPGAGDDMIITGEKTGAGAETAITITMNETATTDYGAASTSLVTPAMAICDGGILRYGTTAATNYYLKLSGHCIVYSGGQLDIGTTGTPIPRDSTAVLEFDPAADGDMGLTIRNLGTLNSQGLSRTSGKNIIVCKLNTDEAANSTSLGVDTDTGWLDNDEIAVASTTRTASQTEAGTLNGNANASDMTVDGFGGAGGGLANAHSGTSPTQAEVVLLTRNVKIRSATSTIMAFCNFKATSIVDIDWTEFRYLGESATGKRGLEIETTTGSFNMQYSCLRNTEDNGVYMTPTSGSGITISNNIFYALASVSTAGINFVDNSPTITFTNNYMIGGGTGAVSSVVFGVTSTSAGDYPSIFTGNTIAGWAGSGPALAIGNGSTGPVILTGTFSDNIIHSCAGIGLAWETNTSSFFYVNRSTEELLTNTTIWRTNSNGISLPAITLGPQLSWGKLTFDGLIIFGCNTSSIVIPRGSDSSSPGNNVLSNLIFDGLVSNGDSTFSTTNGIEFANKASNNSIDILHNWVFRSCDFSTAGGIKTAHTVDIEISETSANFFYISWYLDNCKLGAATEFASGDQANLLIGSFIKSTNHDQTSGNHKSWFKYGTITSDSTHYNTATPSERLTPIDASNKLVSGSKKVAIASGQAATIHVYVRESEAGDGAAYNGARARLMVKRNDALGITSDTLIDTATAASDGAFEELTGASAAVSADGVLEFYVEVDGTTGWVNVDDWSVTVA